MFRTAELGQKLSKQEFKEIEPTLRQELLLLQRQLRVLGKTPVIVVFAGVDGGGKSATVALLNAWMDARWLINRAYREPSDEENERPEFWRYWRDLPPRGRIGLFLSSWYSRPVLDRAYNTISVEQLDKRLDRIVAFENALVDDGALILKFWMHLSRPAQKTRLKSLQKDPLLSWQVTDKDWDHWRMYDSFIEAAERTIMRTHTGKSPWSIVEGVEHGFRSVAVCTQLRDTLQKQIVMVQQEHKQPAAYSQDDEPGVGAVPVQPKTVFYTLPMDQALEKKAYREKLKAAQAQLNLLHRQALAKNISSIMVFEGPDAAGKGGAIRRLIAALDPHIYQVLPFAAPSDEERARHYLWRFWRHLSRAGHCTLFDRSWYGRVLVERVEGFAGESEWRRAYAEINDFEDQLTEHGIVLIKFWIHITEQEQLARFQHRSETPHKRWKLTDEDWRNREKWHEYELAAHDMVQYTSTKKAPWTLVSGNNKYFARLQVIHTVVDAFKRALPAKKGGRDAAVKHRLIT